MRHVLLTWNPGPYDDEQWTPDDWDSEMVEGTSQDQTIESTWSVGNRVRGIDPGDRAYLLRQGPHGRGVVAIGEITSEPFSAASWRGDGNLAQYVEVTWQEAVPLNDRLDIAELKTSIPQFKWDSVYSSGRDISAYGEALSGLWFGRANDTPALPPVVRGAGFGSADQNRRVERAAIRHVTEAYEAEGYNVTSVESQRCGWDLTVTNAHEEWHVEVKGVAGTLIRFFLTANEHRVALTDANRTLVVVTDALGSDPNWFEMDGPTAATHADPALFQVRVPHEVFAG